MLNSIDTELKLKVMYAFIVIVEIPLGLFMFLAPDLFISLLGFPNQDPIMYGVGASIWLAFGVISILGFRDPLRFVPILLFQFTYKCIWFIGVILPLVISEQLQVYGIIMVVIFTGFVIGDIIVIPWNTVFKKAST